MASIRYKRTVRRHIEADIQSAFFRWLFYSKVPCKQSAFHIPNGGSRHPVEAANLKRQGVKPGVSDVFIAYPCKGFHGLWLEFKAPGNKLTKNQENWLKMMQQLGYSAHVVYSLEDAIKVVEEYCNVGNIQKTASR